MGLKKEESKDHNEPYYPEANQQLEEWKTFHEEKKSIVDAEMKAYNELYRSFNIPAVILPKLPD